MSSHEAAANAGNNIPTPFEAGPGRFGVDHTIAAMEQDVQGVTADAYNAAMAEKVDAVDEKYVPSSLMAAEEYVEQLTAFDANVHEELAGDSEVVDGVDRGMAVDLHDRALKGLDNWRLSPGERAEWALVAGTSNVKHLSPKMRTVMENLSDEDGVQSQVEKLAVLKKQAHDRLQLDSAIVEKYGNDDLPRGVVAANTQQKGVSHRRDAISDVVKLDASGRARHENGTRKSRFIEKTDLDQIETHADQIREGLADRNEPGLGIMAEAQDQKPQTRRGRHAAERATEESQGNTPIYDELMAAQQMTAASEPNNKGRHVADAEAVAAQVALEKEREGAAHGLAMELGGDDESWSELSDEQRKIYIEQQFDQAHKAFLQEEGNTEELWELLKPGEQLNFSPYRKAMWPVEPGDLQYGGRGRWARVKAWAGKVKAQTYTFAANPVEYMKHVDRRKKVIIGAVGALATAAGVAMAISMSKHGQGAELAQHYAPINGGSANAAEHTQTLATEAAKLHALTAEHVVSLARGDNPWSLNSDYLQSLGVSNPTNAQIAAVNNESLRLSGIDVAAARSLPVGFELRQPPIEWLRENGIIS